MLDDDILDDAVRTVMRESRLVETRELEDELVRLVLFLLEPDAAPARSA
ncbi:MAG: hypothetical protein WA418_04705 [Bradyrhizobium sp.]